MVANKPKGKRKEEAGNNPRGKRNAKAKRKIKITHSKVIDFGVNPAFATVEKPEEPKALIAIAEQREEPTQTATVEQREEPKTQSATVEKQEKSKAPAAPKKPAVPGVRPMRTRPYVAGTIIAKHGLAAGVTDAMVAELDKAYDPPNPTESRICLKNAYHAARGYLGIAEDAVK